MWHITWAGLRYSVMKEKNTGGFDPRAIKKSQGTLFLREYAHSPHYSSSVGNRDMPVVLSPHRFFECSENPNRKLNLTKSKLYIL